MNTYRIQRQTSSLFRHAALACVTIGFLSGCASSVTRDASTSAGAPVTASTTHFGTKPVIVNVTLDDTAREELKDNLKFDAKSCRRSSKPPWTRASCSPKPIRPMRCT